MQYINSITELPPEIIGITLSILPFNDFLNSRLICRNWHEITQDFYKTKIEELTNFNNYNQLLNNFDGFSARIKPDENVKFSCKLIFEEQVSNIDIIVHTSNHSRNSNDIDSNNYIYKNVRDDCVAIISNEKDTLVDTPAHWHYLAEDLSESLNEYNGVVWYNSFSGPYEFKLSLSHSPSRTQTQLIRRIFDILLKKIDKMNISYNEDIDSKQYRIVREVKRMVNFLHLFRKS